MEKYTNLTNNYVQKFKPLIEKSVGISLGDIIVRETNPKYDELDCPMQADTEKNTIIVNENIYQRHAEEIAEQGLVNHYPRFDLQHASLHEMSHLAHNKIIPRYYLNKVFHISFIEGFALYMSLEHLSNLYDADLKKDIDYIKNIFSKPSEYFAFSLGFNYDPYHRGYKFFKEILKELGEDNIFKVAVTIPESEEELVRPELYIRRILSKNKE